MILTIKFKKIGLIEKQFFLVVFRAIGHLILQLLTEQYVRINVHTSHDSDSYDSDSCDLESCDLDSCDSDSHESDTWFPLLSQKWLFPAFILDRKKKKGFSSLFCLQENIIEKLF